MSPRFVLSSRMLASTAAIVVGSLASCARGPVPTSAEPNPPAVTSPADSEPGLLRVPRQEVAGESLEHLRQALGAYEAARASLAADELEGTRWAAADLARALRRAAASEELVPLTAAVLKEAAHAAESLGKAHDLEAARLAFGEVSRFLMPVAVADQRLAEGWHAFSCPMAKGFNKWMQPSEEVANPFMGQAMPGCGEPADWTVRAPETPEEVAIHGEHAHGTGGEIAYYTCSMHPSVRNEAPGTCPICSMDLVPVTVEEIETGAIRVDATVRQTIGVTTAPVERRPLSVRIRAVGKVVYDERRLAEVNLKLKGWVEELYVDEPGQRVEKGEPLLALYSPELYAAQEELLVALASQEAARGTAAPERADYLVAAARRRLRLLDLEEWQIDAIARDRTLMEQVPILSPVSGHVTEKNIVAGSTVEPGQVLYRIADLQRVWVEAEVYESELPLVEVGQEATMTLPYLPGRSFTGKVTFIYPYLDDASRTGRVRLELANPGLALKPDMYANVELVRHLGERLVVPEEAVLHAGDRHFVFLDLGEGRLKPRAVELGLRSGDDFAVLSGLTEGDVVVTSGNFLIAAEARLKLAMEHWQ